MSAAGRAAGRGGQLALKRDGRKSQLVLLALDV